MEPATTCTDHIIVTTKKSGLKIEIYRHKQSSPTGISALSLTMPSYSTMIDVLPKLLFAFVCIAFMLQRSSLCNKAASRPGISKLTSGICAVSEAIPLTPLAGILFVVTVVKQVRKTISRKREKKDKQQ